MLGQPSRIGSPDNSRLQASQRSRYDVVLLLQASTFDSADISAADPSISIVIPALKKGNPNHGVALPSVSVRAVDARCENRRNFAEL